eukprot:gene7228-8667_t
MGGVAIGAVVDRFAGRMKQCIVLCYGVASVGFFLFALTVVPSSPISYSRGLLYTTAL